MIERCLRCFFTCSPLLALVVCLHAVEASNCPAVINKKVEDTVELSSCIQTEIDTATWKYEDKIIAEKDYNISAKQFEGRLNLNPKNFSLTITNLTLQDSGKFSFFSSWGSQQMKTHTVTLHVLEPITLPVVNSNLTWHTSTNSCTVFLECSSPTDHRKTYRWTIENQTTPGGPSLNYTIRATDSINFTCTVSNVVSEAAASKVLKCSNKTENQATFPLMLWVGIGAGCSLFVGIALFICHCKIKQPVVSEQNDLTVYADITPLDENSSTSKPISLYESVDTVFRSVPGPQTVYDQIQFSRERVSPRAPPPEVRPRATVRQ